MKRLLGYFLFLFGTLCLCGFSIPHKFYCSIAELEYNAKSKSAEMILHVYPDDWEQAISALHQKKVRMEDADIAATSLPYLQKHIHLLSPKGKNKPFQLIGVKNAPDMTEIYLEFPLTEGLEGCSLQQKVLLEQFESQVNVVNILSGEQKGNLVFKAGNEAFQPIHLHP